MTQSTLGWLNGFIGVLIFSASLPATRVAVADFDPVFLTAARAMIAGVLAIAALSVMRSKIPSPAEWGGLFVVAFGVVLGFPLLTAWALQHVTASHSTVYIGMLPLMTSLFAVMRGGERPHPYFWLFSCLGSALVSGFALSRGFSGLSVGDACMLAAIIVCGLGYAEGAKLSRHLGGWQVISWALVLSFPVMAPFTFFTQPDTFANVRGGAWMGLAYVSVFSMFVGFIFWYRGLVLGGIAAVGQLQLLQPFFALGWAWLILSEEISPLMMMITIAVVFCVYGAKRVSFVYPKPR